MPIPRIAAILVATGLLLSGAVRGTENTERDVLNHGYAQLHATFDSLRWTDEIFLLKFENERIETIGRDLSETAASLAQRLEDLSESYPALALDDDGLPEIERRKQEAVRRDRILSFAPLTGRSGPNFERTLLLSSSGALNQMRHLCKVMLELETEPGLQDYLQDARKEMERLYARVVVALNEDYFTHNTYTPPTEFRHYTTGTKGANPNEPGR